MKWLRLIFALAVFVPAFALAGALSTFDSHFPIWWGLTVGVGIGILFGLIFGGGLPRKAADFLFGPEDPDFKDD
jgi:hypothetical protein